MQTINTVKATLSLVSAWRTSIQTAIKRRSPKLQEKQHNFLVHVQILLHGFVNLLVIFGGEGSKCILIRYSLLSLAHLSLKCKILCDLESQVDSKLFYMHQKNVYIGWPMPWARVKPKMG